MMNFDVLKQVVYQTLSKEKFENLDPKKNIINSILSGVLLFKTLEELINNDALKADLIKDTAAQYIKTYKNISESLEKEYISYKQIKKIIEDNDLKNFININFDTLNEIFKVYQNKTKIKEFNCSEFSSAIYRLSGLKEQDNIRLSKVHFNVLVPIFKYYQTYFNINTKDVTVEDVGNRVGTEIKLSILKIPCNQIYIDIDSNNLNVKQYLRNFTLTSDGFIKLMIK